MKEALSHIIRLLGSLLLIIVAISLTLILLPIAFIHLLYITATLEKRKARDILTSLKIFFTNVAASIDQTGNALYGLLWNYIFIKKNTLYYPFGDKDETISEVLGWNEKYHISSLTKTAKVLIWILNKLEKDHCQIAYQKGIENTSAKYKLHLEYTKIK